MSDVRNRDEARRVTDLQKQVATLENEARDRQTDISQMLEQFKQANKEKEDMMNELKEKVSDC